VFLVYTNNMEFLFRLNDAYHTTRCNGKNLLTVMLEQNATNVEDTIMDDPTITIVNWKFVELILQEYMGYALQIKMAHTYLVHKFGPQFNFCDHEMLESLLDDNDKQYLEFLSSRQDKFNIQPYLMGIKFTFENKIFDIGTAYQNSDETQQDVLLELHDKLFHDTYDQLLNNPELYTTNKDYLPLPSPLYPLHPLHQQQLYDNRQQQQASTSEIDGSGPSRKRMRGS